MRAYLEMTDPKSCLSKARITEMIFVLLGRDKAAPAAIRAWAQERCSLGLNKPEDSQIQEALLCADTMDNERPR